MRLDRLTAEKSVIVCCGAGGVGKTTTSAALALSAARSGRRALVLTIDPAKRLAQALDIPLAGEEPVKVHEDRLNAGGIELAANGALYAWMLDPRVVLEGVVDRFAPDPADAERIRQTSLYQALGDIITGLQEYTAAEALFSFHEQSRYDLIVLDTPPSRNALDFLDAPRRLSRFLDERTLAIFLGGGDGRRAGALLKAASRIVGTALSHTFGEEFLSELRVFLSSFSKLFGRMRIHAEGVRTLLKSDASAFLVITSPTEVAVEEARFFRKRIAELGLRSDGFVLNRSYAATAPSRISAQEAASMTSDPLLADALRKVTDLAKVEQRAVERDRALLEALEEEGRLDSGGGVFALPAMEDAVESMAALRRLSDFILGAHERPARVASASPAEW